MLGKLVLIAREWRWELFTTAVALLLTAAFWVWWTYGLGLDSPVTPSHVVFIFLAMVKVALFNFLSWALAIPITKGEGASVTLKVWAVLLICLSLSALG